MNSAKNALFESISSRKTPFVFWTGAGLSAPLPGWGALLNEIIRAAKIKAKELSDPKELEKIIKDVSAEKNLWLAFDKLIDSERGIGTESFKQIVRTELGKSLKLSPPNAQQQLWALRPKGIVTLNLDHFTLRSAGLQMKNDVPICIYPEQFSPNIGVFKEERPFIAYPHGYLDAWESWTFTSAKLNLRLADEGYRNWINTLFATTTVVFIGVTADDIAIGSLLNNILKQNVPITGHFWITSRTDSLTDTWAESHGIRVVRYDPIDSNHSGLNKMLTELAAYKTPENPELEKPVTSTKISTFYKIPPPDQLDLRNKENLRSVLNLKADSIFSIKDPIERDREFSKFLVEYEDSVMNAYHVSLSPGRNIFFGMHLAEKCGQGAFGTVYKAYKETGDIVAVKILNLQNFEKPDFYRNFRRGVNSLRIVQEYSIGGVVKIEGAHEIPPALVMEWVDGSTLHDVVHQNRLNDWRGRVAKMLELGKILASSHALPEIVLHRDLRPANVMLRDCEVDAINAEVVVLDFDLSWHKGAEDYSIMHSPALGYLAPEQRRKKPGIFTRSTLVDSYGFGMTLYFVCTKSDPIPDQHLLPNWGDELILKICQQPCHEWKSLPKRIGRLIQGCTKEEQARRLDFSQINGELESLLSGIDDHSNISSLSIVIEELATRCEYFRGYTWDSLTSSASLIITDSLTYKLTAEIPDRAIRLDINWRNAGTQDWGQIEKLLNTGVPKMMDKLKKSGWSAKMSKETRSFTVLARIGMIDALTDIQNIATALDDALNHASTASGYR